MTTVERAERCKTLKNIRTLRTVSSLTFFLFCYNRGHFYDGWYDCWIWDSLPPPTATSNCFSYNFSKNCKSISMFIITGNRKYEVRKLCLVVSISKIQIKICPETCQYLVLSSHLEILGGSRISPIDSATFPSFKWIITRGLVGEDNYF